MYDTTHAAYPCLLTFSHHLTSWHYLSPLEQEWCIKNQERRITMPLKFWVIGKRRDQYKDIHVLNEGGLGGNHSTCWLIDTLPLTVWKSHLSLHGHQQGTEVV